MISGERLRWCWKYGDKIYSERALIHLQWLAAGISHRLFSTTMSCWHGPISTLFRCHPRTNHRYCVKCAQSNPTSTPAPSVKSFSVSGALVVRFPNWNLSSCSLGCYKQHKGTITAHIQICDELWHRIVMCTKWSLWSHTRTYGSGHGWQRYLFNLPLGLTD